jgi:DNA-binding response OmpR family regulator
MTGWGDEAITVGRRPCVLVADDDEDMRALLGIALRRDGYDVIEACDGAEVIEIMGKRLRAPDAIVADVRMPGITGLSALSDLRRDGCMTPFIIMTAQGGPAAEELRALAERLGADAILSKPFDLDDLRTLVMNLMRPSDPPRACAPTLPDL